MAQVYGEIEYDIGLVDTFLDTGPNGQIVTTTKGDLVVSNGARSVRFPVGVSGSVLCVNPTPSGGVVWDSNIVRTAPEGSIPNGLVKYTDSSGKFVRNGNVTLDNSNNMAGIGDLDISGNFSINGNNAFNAQQATSLVTATITGTTYTLVPSMTLTITIPGTYILSFSTTGDRDGTNTTHYYAIFQNGVIISHSEREYQAGGNDIIVLYTQALVTVTTTTTFTVRARTDAAGGALTFRARNFVYFKVAP